MSDFFGKLKSGAGKVAFEADKMSRLSKAQGELNQIKKQIEADYIKLGEMYYRQFFNQATGTASVPVRVESAFSEICQHVFQMEQQLTWKNEELQRISAETYNPQGGASAQHTQSAPVQQAPVTQPEPVVPPEPSPVVTPPPPLENFSAVETPQAQVPFEPETPAPTTRFCPNCGKEQSVNIKFCTECGTRLM